MDMDMPAREDSGVGLAHALESEEQKQARMERLDALGQALAKTRSEAINGREMSGVEQDWMEDEEFYQGIDDANRGEHRSVWHQKPPGQAAQKSGSEPTQSTVFPNITGPYVDAASARISDMLLPTDDRSWGIEPTPIPELVPLSEGEISDDIMDAAVAESGGDVDLAKTKVRVAVEAAMAVIAEAKKKAEKAQTRIEDWHVECQWHAHVRKVIEDAARIGTGVLKGPIPQMRRSVAFMNGAIQIRQEIKPGSKRIDPWNFYPDPACGEDIQSGAYTWERDRLTKKQLRELKKQPGYIGENIDLCMEEGAQVASGSFVREFDPRLLTESQKRAKFEVWYYHGTIEKEDLEAAGCDCAGMKDPHLPALVTMVNNRIIRASLNPLDTGSFPYDVMVWRAKANHWTGIGVGRQIRTPQRIVVAASRHLMDNAGLASGPLVIIKSGVVEPVDGVMSIKPRKFFQIAQDADEIADVKSVFGTVKIDMVVDELMTIIKFGLQLAEDVTGMPLLLQGQQGKAPDTVGGMQMLNNNASAVLRRLARLFDDRVTEPHVRRYYEWLLQYGKDDEKGDYQIDAHGSSALVERDIQNQELAALGKVVLDPRFGLDPRKWVQEYLKSRHFDPARFEFDDDQWKKIVENMAKGPQDPRLAAAQIKAASEERLAKFWGEMEKQAAELHARFEEQENARDRALELFIKDMEQTGEKTVSLDVLKAKLAEVTIRAETQMKLSRENATREALKPAAEPIGRAPKGQSFTK